jgi:hypothetical protein
LLPIDVDEVADPPESLRSTSTSLLDSSKSLSIAVDKVTAPSELLLIPIDKLTKCR